MRQEERAPRRFRRLVNRRPPRRCGPPSTAPYQNRAASLPRRVRCRSGRTVSILATTDLADDAGRYSRYRIESHHAPDLSPHPPRFAVKVSRLALARLLLRELVEHRGNLRVVLSRPCVYGVFSGPVGGFAPRERLCVGCLPLLYENEICGGEVGDPCGTADQDGT